MVGFFVILFGMHKCRDELRQKRIASELFLNAVRSMVGDGAQLNHTAHPSDGSGLGENAVKEHRYCE